MNLNPHIAAVIAQFDYNATGTNQISFCAGDKLIVAAADAEVVEQGEDWVFARHATTLEEGFVPSNFLKITSAEEESRLQILADIRDLKYQLDAELHFKDGLRDIIRRSKDENEKTVAKESLADSEKRIDEIEDQLDKLEAAYKQAKFDENFQENEDTDEEDEEYEPEPVAPLQPFTGELKSVLKTNPPQNKQMKSVRFNSPKTMSEIHEEIQEERKIGVKEVGSGEPTGHQNTAPTQPPPVAPPRKASLDAAISSGSSAPPKPTERSSPRKKTVSVADLENPTLKGFLHIYQSSGLKSWNKRYFVLKDSVLYMYKKPSDSDTYDKVVLPSYTVSPCSIGGKHWAFKAEHPGCKSFIFGAENKEDFTSWLNALSLATIVMSIDEARVSISDQSTPDTKRKRRSIEGAREGLALKAFRNSITHFDDD